MISTDSSGARPTMTMASQPQLLPAMAKPLLARESLMRSVSGLLLTTANFAEVVSGLPTSGLNAKTSGASGASGSTCALPSSSSSRTPRPLPPMNWRRTASASGTRLPARCRRSTRRCEGSSRGNRTARYPPASADRISTRSSSPSGVSGIADESIAVQVGGERGMQPIDGDELSQVRASALPASPAAGPGYRPRRPVRRCRHARVERRETQHA